jgi:dCTP diphosphatase
MPDDTSTLRQLRDLVRAFVAERKWERYHDPKNLSMSIAIEAAELMEHFQWIRNEELPALLAKPDERARIVDEVADVLAYVLALANVMDLDLSDAVRAKLQKNAVKYPAEQFQGNYYKPR